MDFGTMVITLIGTGPLNYITDINGLVTAVYDTEYITKAILLIMTLWFIYKLLLSVVRNVGRSE